MSTSEEKVSENVKQVIIVALGASTAIMAYGLFSGNTDGVLPFATGVIGFAGGLVAAIFGK
jgi:hypothetical protein